MISFYCNGVFIERLSISLEIATEIICQLKADTGDNWHLKAWVRGKNARTFVFDK